MPLRQTPGVITVIGVSRVIYLGVGPVVTAMVAVVTHILLMDVGLMALANQAHPVFVRPVHLRAVAVAQRHANDIQLPFIVMPPSAHLAIPRHLMQLMILVAGVLLVILVLAVPALLYPARQTALVNNVGLMAAAAVAHQAVPAVGPVWETRQFSIAVNVQQRVLAR